MPRRRRYIESGGLYEICIRVRSGIPLPCRKLLEILIKSSLARTQRDLKVLISHHIWMGNHAHLLVIAKDATQLTRFYGELQKRLTDYLKRLLGKKHLDLWEGAPSVIRIADIEAAIERIVYFFANPSKAGLVDSIESYPGYSSWGVFNKGTNTLRAKFIEEVAWIKAPSIPKAPRLDLTETQEQTLCDSLNKDSRGTHTITLYPNIWFSCFGITEPKEIEELNTEIQTKLKSREKLYAIERQERGVKVLGARLLKRQALWVAHTPTRKDRRIFVIARSREVRLAYIEFMKQISYMCTRCYEAWKKGLRIEGWPPGTFPPPMPLCANALA